MVIGGVGSSLISKIRYLPENQMLSPVCLEMAVQVSLITGRRFRCKIENVPNVAPSTYIRTWAITGFRMGL
jgi:hypothetical protein